MASQTVPHTQGSPRPPPPTIWLSRHEDNTKLRYVPRDRMSEKENSIMFVGICIAVVVALATPMIWVWMADRIKRRKMDPFRKFRDLERGKKRGDATPPPYEIRPAVDSIWARQEKYKTAKPARAVTADQVLGIDKTSYLRRIVPQSEGSSQLLTVAPAHLGWARQRITPADDEEPCISPWDAEHAPNPVIFPWLQKRGLKPTSLDTESRQGLQVMAMTTSSTAQTWSASPSRPRISAEDPFLDSPTEYSSSSRNSEKSCGLSDAGLEEGDGSAQRVGSRITDSEQASTSSTRTPNPLQCDVCQTLYPTQGQLNMHLNRKHRRRYRCQHCPSAFALQADLRRHERSVHKDMYEVQSFYCPNAMCTIPHKKFTRRDNFERHVRRCRNRETG